MNPPGPNAEFTPRRRTLCGVSGTVRHPSAARDRLVRLLVVVAVLTGLVLTLGLQCTDGMGSGTHVAMGMSTTADGGTSAMDVGEPSMAVVVADGAPGSHDLGSLLAACLVFIVAVAAAVAVFRPARLAGFVRLFDVARGTVVRAVEQRAPSLAQLCVLRT
jgi:hypothetical protein